MILRPLEKYYQFMFDLVFQQPETSKMVLLQMLVLNIFDDFGFGKSDINMTLLAVIFPLF